MWRNDTRRERGGARGSHDDRRLLSCKFYEDEPAGITVTSAARLRPEIRERGERDECVLSLMHLIIGTRALKYSFDC